ANSRKAVGTSNFGISNLGISNFGISKAGALTATGWGLDFETEEVVVSAIRKHPLIARAFQIGPSALGKSALFGSRHAPLLVHRDHLPMLIHRFLMHCNKNIAVHNKTRRDRQVPTCTLIAAIRWQRFAWSPV